MAFQNLPNTQDAIGWSATNMTGEAVEYYRIYNKVDRTITGTYSFTSTSSHKVYSTDDFDGQGSHPLDNEVYNCGENGMLVYLKKYTLTNYIMDETNMTSLATSVGSLAQNLGTASTQGGVAATGLHADVEQNASDIDDLNSDITEINTNSEKRFTITLSNSSWTAVSGHNGIYEQDITPQITSHLPVTQNTKVDLQPDEITMLQLLEDGVGSLLIKNASTSASILSFVAYSVGAYPTVALNVQATKTEVETLA